MKKSANEKPKGEELENSAVQNEAEQVPPEDAQPPARDDAGESEAKQEASQLDILKLYLEQALRENESLGKELEAQKKIAGEKGSEAYQYKERLSQVVAEYENFRRRTAQEKEALLTDAVAKAVSALLPALDSLEKAVDFAQSSPESFRQGVEMTLKQLKTGLEKLGVSEIEAEGSAFNPDIHNAVAHEENDQLGESVVAEVFQKGYKIGEKVIRHSVVKVAN